MLVLVVDGRPTRGETVSMTYLIDWDHWDVSEQGPVGLGGVR